MVASLVLMFVRNPGALFALSVAAMAMLLTNDTFATHANDRMMRVVRKASPPMAARLRARVRAEGIPRGPPTLYILGAKRRLVVLSLAGLSLLLVFLTSALTKLFWCFFVGFGLCTAHACLRTHNLKARLASTKEDFRSVWRDVQL